MMNGQKKNRLYLISLIFVLSVHPLKGSDFNKLATEYTRIMVSWQKNSSKKLPQFRKKRDESFGNLLKKLGDTPEELLLKARIFIHLNRNNEVAVILSKASAKDEESFYTQDIKFLRGINSLKKRDYSKASSYIKPILNERKASYDYYQVCLALAFNSVKLEEKKYFAEKFLEAGTLTGKFKKYQQKVENLLAEVDSFNKKRSPYLSEERPEINILKKAGTPATIFTTQKWLPKRPELREFKGKVTILHFWQPAKSQNQQILKDLQEVTDKNEVVKVIAINRIKGVNPSIPPAVEMEEVRSVYSSLYPAIKFHSSLNGEVFTSYNVKKIPSTVIINKQGEIDTINLGNIPAEDIKKRIQDLSEVKYGTN